LLVKDHHLLRKSENVARRLIVFLTLKTFLAAGSFCEALPASKRNTKAFALVFLFGAGKRT